MLIFQFVSYVETFTRPGSLRSSVIFHWFLAQIHWLIIIPNE
jgi:hypothetical protein